jgi:hypothetical protein
VPPTPVAKSIQSKQPVSILKKTSQFGTVPYSTNPLGELPQPMSMEAATALLNNPILGGLFEKKPTVSATSYPKQQSGTTTAATIVDENGELPEIPSE